MAIQQYPNRAAALADFALGQLDLWSADLSTIGSTVVEDNKIWAITGASASSLVRERLPGSLLDQLQKGAKTVRVSAGVDTSTNADFNNIVILGNGHTPYLHEVSDSSYLGSTISYFSSGPTELTFQNGETTVRGNLKINQWQGVTATCVAVGAEDATVWYLIGGSPS